MRDYEHGSTGVLYETDKLRLLIQKYPDLPLAVLAGTDATDGEHNTTFCSEINAWVGELLDCNTDVDGDRIFTDREEFEDCLKDRLWQSFDGTQKEFDMYFERELLSYDPYWKPCILVEVNN